MSDSIYGPADKSPSKKRPRTTNNDNDVGGTNKNNAKTKTKTKSRLVSNQNNTVRYNKRLLSETQRVPWIDVFELQAVGRSLLAVLDNNNNQSHNQSNNKSNIMMDPEMSMEDALERVEVWKARCCGGLDLPHAIESTAALAQILWKESISISTNSSSCGYSSFNTTTFLTMELRLSYASAVIRTINGLTDHVNQQQERAVATSSVAHICQVYLNIPSWLVDVRHEATHNQLPTLSVLRMAAKYMLQYLCSTYWQPLLSMQHQRQQQNQGEPNVVLEYLQIYEELINTTCIQSENTMMKKAASKPTVNNSNGKIKDSDESNQQQDYKNDDDGDGDDDPLLLRSSRLGTNINMFAVLMESSKKDKKKKKKEQKLLQEQQAKAERIQKEEAGRLAQQQQPPPPFWKSSLAACAEQLVKVSTSSSSSMMIPIDVLWTVMLSHFIWRPRTIPTTTTTTTANIRSCTCCVDIHHNTSCCCCRGVLVPTCLQSFPPTMKSINTLRNRYRPLLVALGQQWPGLLSALLVHIVDGMIMTSSSSSSSCGAAYSPSGSFSLLVSNNNQSSSTDMNGPSTSTTTTTPRIITFQTLARKQQGLYFLDSWARFLLSSSFLVDSLGLQSHDQKQQQQQQPNTNSSVNNHSKTSDDEPACREILQAVMQYPLNSLCDRLLSISEKDDTSRAITTTNATTTSTCRKLGLYLQDILGDDRHDNFGVAITEKEQDGCLYRSLSTLANANMDKQTNCLITMAKNDTNSNESIPLVFGPSLPNDESSSSEQGNHTKEEHGDESNRMDQEETMECDVVARTVGSIVAMDIIHGPKSINDVAICEEENSNGKHLSMESETQMGQTADYSHVNNKAKHDDKEEQGEPTLAGCNELNVTAGSSLSLAQMEVLLFKQSHHKGTDDAVQETAAHYEPMLQSVGETVPLTNPAAAVPDTQQQQQQHHHHQKRSPWVKCLAWDACAIGSLPGYPL